MTAATRRPPPAAPWLATPPQPASPPCPCTTVLQLSSSTMSLQGLASITILKLGSSSMSLQGLASMAMLQLSSFSMSLQVVGKHHHLAVEPLSMSLQGMASFAMLQLSSFSMSLQVGGKHTCSPSVITCEYPPPWFGQNSHPTLVQDLHWFFKHCPPEIYKNPLFTFFPAKKHKFAFGSWKKF